MKPLNYIDYQRAKWEGVRRLDAPERAPGFEAVGRTIGSAVPYMGPHGYPGPSIKLPPLGWMPLGDVISIPAGRWVDMVTRVSNIYGERRGVRAGARVRLPSGVMGRVAFLPRTTCADIGRAFGGDRGGWAAQMAKDGFLRPAGPAGSGILTGFDPFALRLIKMRGGLSVRCTDPNVEYPLNDEFWVLARRLAIELDSRKAIPSAWELVVESVEEAWDDFVEALPDMPGLPSLLPSFDFGAIMLYSALGFGAYLLLKGKR